MRIHSIETLWTHDGPGIRLVIFLQGCHFRCLYCHNPDTQEMNGGREVSVLELESQILRQQAYFGTEGGVTASGGEPTLQAHELWELFTRLKKHGIHTTLDTNGHILTDDVRALLDVTDLVLLDVKHIDAGAHIRLTGISNINTLKMLHYLESIHKPTWLRYVLVPGYTDDPRDLQAFWEKLGHHTCIERVQILPYHILGVSKYEKLHRPYPLEGVPVPTSASIEAARAIFARYFPFVTIGG